MVAICHSSRAYLLPTPPKAGPLPASAPTLKKRRKADAAAAADWPLRTRVLRALHRFFLHAPAGGVDVDTFTRLLPPLAATLEVDAPAAVDEALAAGARFVCCVLCCRRLWRAQRRAAICVSAL